jgi:zinc protease
VVYPSGSIETEYYEISTGLKIRKTTSTLVQNQTVESIADFSDYREVAGIKFPYRTKQQVSGQLIDIKTDKIDIVTPPNQELFKK